MQHLTSLCMSLKDNIYCSTCKVSEMVQRRDNGGAPPLQKEQHHDGEGKVSSPGSGDAAGDAVSSGPAAHSEHEASDPWIKLSVQVEQLCALHCHPVDNTQECYEYLQQLLHVFMRIC